MLAWLSKSKNPCVIGMTVFGCDHWLEYGCIAPLCVSQFPLVPCGNHPQLEGGSGAEILLITLAYGWVEHCNDIAICEEASSQDKYYCVLNICKLFVLLINMNMLNA